MICRLVNYGRKVSPGYEMNHGVFSHNELNLHGNEVSRGSHINHDIEVICGSDPFK